MSSRRCRESIASSRSWITRLSRASPPMIHPPFPPQFPSPSFGFPSFREDAPSIDNTGARWTCLDLHFRPCPPRVPGTQQISQKSHCNTRRRTLAMNRLLVSRGEKERTEVERKKERNEKNTRETHEPTAGEAP